MAMSTSAEAPSSATVRDGGPSPRQTKRKKASDPFLDLEVDLDRPLSVPLVVEEDKGSHQETIFDDFVLAPLNMISFILSLFLVDRQQRQWRLSQHGNGSDSLWSRVTHWSLLDPQPYQDPKNGTWGPSHAPAAAQSPSSTSYQGWYARKKHRAMAKLEFNDAFAMRKRVVVALVVWLTAGIFALSYAARSTYAWLSGR